MEATTECSRDPKGHYEALRLKPGAAPDEIIRAYRSLEEEWRQCHSFSRFPVQEAFRYLSDPERKAAYDARAIPEPPEPSASRRMLILSFILVTLVSHAGFVFPGFLRPGPDSFHAGDVLVRTHDQSTLGRVSRQEIDHRFSRGDVARAYLVRTSEGEERWYPASELERHYEPASSAPAGR